MAKQLKEIGINLKIITGKQEASLLIDFNKNIQDSAVIDIGGGSVEVCINKAGKMHYESFQLGAVRLLNLDQNRRNEVMREFSSWLKLHYR